MAKGGTARERGFFDKEHEKHQRQNTDKLHIKLLKLMFKKSTAQASGIKLVYKLYRL